MTNKCELTKCECYKANGRWYMHIEYAYETKRGKHVMIVPKVALPFQQENLLISHCVDGRYDPNRIRIESNNEMVALPAPVFNLMTGENFGEHDACDFLIESYIHKMTKKDMKRRSGTTLKS